MAPASEASRGIFYDWYGPAFASFVAFHVGAPLVLSRISGVGVSTAQPVEARRSSR